MGNEPHNHGHSHWVQGHTPISKDGTETETVVHCHPHPVESWHHDAPHEPETPPTHDHSHVHLGAIDGVTHFTGKHSHQHNSELKAHHHVDA